MRLLAALALTALLTGCSADETEPDVTASQPLGESAAPSQAAPPAAGSPSCEQLIRDGQPASTDLISNGCSRPDGSTFDFQTVDCKDGRKLVTYENRFHAYVGETWKTGAGETETAACRG